MSCLDLHLSASLTILVKRWDHGFYFRNTLKHLWDKCLEYLEATVRGLQSLIVSVNIIQANLMPILIDLCSSGHKTNVYTSLEGSEV